MNLRQININLLIMLEALLAEKNVTKAAKKNLVTQSTMSCTLKQLRILFKDELLIRNGKKMVLTPCAEKLIPQVAQLLVDIKALLQNTPFDPKTSSRVFTIGMTEYANFLLFPSLYNYFKQHAPHILLKVNPIIPFTEKQLRNDEYTDLNIGIMREIKPKQGELLFSEKLVCVANARHPLMKKPLTMKNYLAAEHLNFLIVHEQEKAHFNIDSILAATGQTRRIAVSMGHIISALALLEKTELLAVLPENLVKSTYRYFKLSTQTLPFTLPKLPVALIWHKRFNNDSAHIWLRQVIKNIAVTSLR